VFAGVLGWAAMRLPCVAWGRACHREGSAGSSRAFLMATTTQRLWLIRRHHMTWVPRAGHPGELSPANVCVGDMHLNWPAAAWFGCCSMPYNRWVGS
jgi:hypothetical protein